MRQLSLIGLYTLITIYSLLISSISSLQPKTRVILIGIDGLLQRCLKEAKHNIIDYFMFNGAYTFKARTAIQAKSAPGWTNILCGMDSETSGIINNDWVAPWLNKTIIKPQITPESGDDIPIPCVFQKIKKAKPEAKVKAFFSWEWFVNINNSSIPNSIDKEKFCFMSDTPSSIKCDDEALQMAKEMISEDFDFLFLYLGSLDEVGHEKGFCNQDYITRLGKLDDIMLDVFSHLAHENILDSTHIIFTTDHGANYKGYDHGTFNDDNINIPWMILGPNIQRQHEIRSFVRNYDTASTIMKIFGQKPDFYWRGKVVEEVFNDFEMIRNHEERFLNVK
jgi:hypothetical protein